MDALHEAVEMDALPACRRKAVEKQVHQPGLAAPDCAPEVETANRRRPPAPEPVEQRRLSAPLQFVPEIVQSPHDRQLVRIMSECAAVDELLIAGQRRVSHRYVVGS
jgi:hypothetical protein